MSQSISLRAELLAIKTDNAWSFYRYRSWTSVAKVLLNAGYTEQEAEAIMRSKWTRWAADAFTGEYGKAPARAVTEYLNKMTKANREKGVAELVKETF